MIKTGDVLSDSKNYVLSDPGLITSIIRVALDQLKLSITSNIMEQHKAKAAKAKLASTISAVCLVCHAWDEATCVLVHGGAVCMFCEPRVLRTYLVEMFPL